MRPWLIQRNLSRVYDSYFSIINSQLCNYTVNVNEYSYFFLFLIEHYMEPALKVAVDAEKFQ
jgi:hypothetical protein